MTELLVDRHCTRYRLILKEAGGGDMGMGAKKVGCDDCGIVLKSPLVSKYKVSFK